MDYEKLGAFYLGKEFDLAARRRGDVPVLYDSRDLVTHAVCVGMTGSGKTGLCIGLIEEAAIDGIPAIVIDPKGDLANLLLTFPELRAEDFRSWINEDDARRKDQSPDEYAAAQAALWKNGLAEWQQDGGRIARLKAAADFAIYTPGSSAGLPVSILKSFAAPTIEVIEDRDVFRERIGTAAASLLGLLGIDADPIQSRDHILLSTILETSWRAGRDVDLGQLVRDVQQPPVTRIGVMELETFYPAQERFGMAMQINNLLASPGFASWTEGEALDIGSLLYTPAGKPRVCIFSIAHLSDGERMFFVSLLLSQVLGWTRAQSGTTSLRALIYMDEIAGYCPPVANPPSKQPMMLLMKQARAFGVGMVLATQNPVDIDYKGLSNAGTWFIGRLQTERDKARVLDGLEGAAATASSGFDRATVEQMLSALGSRVFLMNNVHDDRPTIFETRWVLSYLRGPLTRGQIKTLMDPRKAAAVRATPPAATPTATESGTASPARATTGASRTALDTSAATKRAPTDSQRAVLSPDIPQFFIPVRSDRPDGAALRYAPLVFASASVYYHEPKQGVDVDTTACYFGQIGVGPVPVDWEHAAETNLTERDVQAEGAGDATFDAVPAAATKPKAYDGFRKDFAAMLFRKRRLELLRCDELELASKPGESEREFRARLALAAREQRDAAVEKLRNKFAPKVATLQERLRKAEQARAVQQNQAREAQYSTAVSFGSAVLGALFGRKKVSAGTVGKAATAARGVGRSMRESGDVSRAEENIDAIQRQMADLEAQFQSAAAEVSGGLDSAAAELTTLSLKPKKTNIKVKAVALVWAPHWLDPAGTRIPAHE